MKLVALISFLGLMVMVHGQGPALQFSCSLAGSNKEIYVRLDEEAGTPLTAVYTDGQQGTCDFVKGAGDFWTYTFDVTNGDASADYAKCGMTTVAGQQYSVRVLTQERTNILTSIDYQFDVTDPVCDFDSITNAISFTQTATSTNLNAGTSTLNQGVVKLELVGVAAGGAETVLTNGAVLNLQTYPDFKIRIEMTDNTKAYKGITVGRCYAYPSASPLNTNEGIAITDIDGCGWLDVANGGMYDTTAKLVGATSATDYIVVSDATITSFKFVNTDDLYFECVYEFCTAGDLATKCDVTTCAKRKRRAAANETTPIGTNNQVEKTVIAGFKVVSELPGKFVDPFAKSTSVASNGAPTASSTVSCLQSLEFLVVVVTLLVLLIVAIGVAIFAVFKARQRSEKETFVEHTYDNRAARR